jgi:DNA-binding LacI/PurR family transcriptional regulator
MRFNGYRTALQEAGIKPNGRWVRELVDWDEATQFVGQGRSTMADWLRDDWKKLGCTAIVAYNDPTAIGAIEALQAAGIAVPEQVSVAGFDGVVDDSYWASRLTSVEVPLQRIGNRAVELLLQQMRKDESLELEEVLPMKLKAQSTTAPVTP